MVLPNSFGWSRPSPVTKHANVEANNSMGKKLRYLRKGALLSRSRFISMWTCWEELPSVCDLPPARFARCLNRHPWKTMYIYFSVVCSFSLLAAINVLVESNTASASAPAASSFIQCEALTSLQTVQAAFDAYHAEYPALTRQNVAGPQGEAFRNALMKCPQICMLPVGAGNADITGIGVRQCWHPQHGNCLLDGLILLCSSASSCRCLSPS